MMQSNPIRRAWHAAPGTGPAPSLRRRAIDRVPLVGSKRKARWRAGTIVPGSGPAARLKRRGRGAVAAVRHPRRRALIGIATAAGAATAVAAASRAHRSSQELSDLERRT